MAVGFVSPTSWNTFYYSVSKAKGAKPDIDIKALHWLFRLKRTMKAKEVSHLNTPGLEFAYCLIIEVLTDGWNWKLSD